MFVQEAARGLGIGRQLLAFLEAQVRGRGVTCTRLETGVYSHDAIRLYERMGYVKIGPFAGYWDDPLSVFYEKRL
jgi:putative acetyltransferase